MTKEEENAPEWYKIALGEMGVKEIPGDKHNPRILVYHATCKYKYNEDEIPWCSSFANWCMHKAGIERTNSAAARSWEEWGAPTAKPKLGDVVVFGRPGSWKGHVGFFVRETKDSVLVLGGNQGNEVNKTWYLKEGYRLRLLGYRTPLNFK